MSKMTKEHWRQWCEQWQQAGPAIEQIRREDLRSKTYDFASADSLLEISDLHGRSRPTSGLVEMQRWFLKLAQRQGLVPTAVREERTNYRVDSGDANPKKQSGSSSRRRKSTPPGTRRSQQ